MNNHTILGVISSDIRLINTNSDKHFIAFVVQDVTKYNSQQNAYNNFHIVKYGDQPNLTELKESLNKGMAVYVSGTGLYNRKRYYNIIAHDIIPVKNLDVRVIEESKGYYERYFSSAEGDVKNDIE